MNPDTIISEYGWLIRFLVRKKIPIADVEDITQDIFTEICHNSSSIVSPSAIGGWIRSLVRNRIADYYRFKNRDVLNENYREDLSATDSMAVPISIDTPAATPSVDFLLKKLSDKYKHVMFLKYVEGLTVSEIAEVTGLDTVEISNRLSYAKKILKKMLTPKKNFHKMDFSTTRKIGS